MSNSDYAMFLAHSMALESEARDRYRELADIMKTHHNMEVAKFFQRMAKEAKHHLSEVKELAEGVELPRLKPWEFEWPGEESPEVASYEALHYRMSLRQAMEIALEHEHAAERYYRVIAEASSDTKTSTVATRFADEEVFHAKELQRMLDGMPENGACQWVEDDDPNMPE